LWNTDQARQPIAARKLHSQSVFPLAFAPDGEQLASGSSDRTVRVWDGRNGSTSSVIEHTFPGWPQSVAFSSCPLAVATKEDITVWDRKTLRFIDAISLSTLSSPFSDVLYVGLSLPVGGSLLAIACDDSSSATSNVTVWDMEGRTVLATFLINSNIQKLTLSPDGSQVFAEIEDGGFRLFDVSAGNASQQAGCEDLSWIPNFNRIPISWNLRNHLMGLFPERRECVTLLYFPIEVRIWSVSVGSSMIAVRCSDGRILLVRS
jgi:WD40 repeat protein